MESAGKLVAAKFAVRVKDEKPSESNTDTAAENDTKVEPVRDEPGNGEKPNKQPGETKPPAGETKPSVSETGSTKPNQSNAADETTGQSTETSNEPPAEPTPAAADPSDEPASTLSTELTEAVTLMSGKKVPRSQLTKRMIKRFKALGELPESFTL